VAREWRDGKNIEAARAERALSYRRGASRAHRRRRRQQATKELSSAAGEGSARESTPANPDQADVGSHAAAGAGEERARRRGTGAERSGCEAPARRLARATYTSFPNASLARSINEPDEDSDQVAPGAAAAGDAAHPGPARAHGISTPVARGSARRAGARRTMAGAPLAQRRTRRRCRPGEHRRVGCRHRCRAGCGARASRCQREIDAPAPVRGAKFPPCRQTCAASMDGRPAAFPPDGLVGSSRSSARNVWASSNRRRSDACATGATRLETRRAAAPSAARVAAIWMPAMNIEHSAACGRRR